MNNHGYGFKMFAEQAGRLQQVRKDDLNTGDRVMIKTCNSVYTIYVLGNGLYRASGGWFDARLRSPFIGSISGCTWGGSAIKPGIIATCGLCLEFGNRVRTSTIQRIVVISAQSLN